MSGLPQSNFPAFYEAADVLRDQGWEIVSPAELDDEEEKANALAGRPSKSSWGDFLARDVKMIADGGIEGIVFLPRWWTSRGARLEATVGLLKHPCFMFYVYDPASSTGKVRQIMRREVAAELYLKAIGVTV